MRRHNQEAWETGWGQLFAAVDEWNDRNKVAPLRRFGEAAEVLLGKDGAVSFSTALEASRVTKVQPYRRRVFSTYAAYLAVRQHDDYSAAIPRLVV